MVETANLLVFAINVVEDLEGWVALNALIIFTRIYIYIYMYRPLHNYRSYYCSLWSSRGTSVLNDTSYITFKPRIPQAFHQVSGECWSAEALRFHPLCRPQPCARSITRKRTSTHPQLQWEIRWEIRWNQVVNQPTQLPKHVRHGRFSLSFREFSWPFPRSELGLDKIKRIQGIRLIHASQCPAPAD